MTGARAMRVAPGLELARSYALALDGYLAAGGEDALRRGYELGRRAMAEGVGVLEMALLHHEALAAALRARRPGAAGRVLRQAEEFVAESLSPYEMTHRGFREAMEGLRQLNETLEKEIQRIALAVHDEAGQLLFAARLAVSGVAQDAGPELEERLTEIGDILDRAEKELRRLSHDLRPTILEELGLVPALRLLARGPRRAKLSIRVESLMEERLPPAIEATVYRVVQEALANVTRHSGAGNARITVACEGRGEGKVLRCVVEDDGKGFDAARGPGLAQPGGLGLVAVRERLGAVGGALEIRSAPGRGTRLIATIPLELEGRR